MKKIAHIAFAMMIFLCFIFCEHDALADGTEKIGGENGFLLSSSSIISAYNNLMDGKDPNYTNHDELLKVEISEFGQKMYVANIPIKGSTNQFGVYFSKDNELLFDFEVIPDTMLIWTGARKELIEQDGSTEMLPQILTAFVYLCDENIPDFEKAEQRANEIIDECSEMTDHSETHGWVQYGGFDYYCATFPITESDGHISLRLIIQIRNHMSVE